MYIFEHEAVTQGIQLISEIRQKLKLNAHTIYCVSTCKQINQIKIVFNAACGLQWTFHSLLSKPNLEHI